MKNKWRRSRLILPTRSEIAFHLALVFLATSAHAAEVIPPKPDRYFNDYAHVVSSGAALRFNEQLAQFERETSDQVVVAVFQKMQSDDDVAAYAQRIGDRWGVGTKAERNGVLVLVFIADRKVSIQVGYGLEGALPDAIAYDIRSNHINPHFRSGDYEGGLAEGIDSIFKAIRGEYKGTGKTVRESSGHDRASSFFGNLILFGFFILISWLLSRVKRKRGYHYSSSGAGWAWALGSGGGGSWSSGGGGGFSGFSGGGGSFGGGGSSGSW